MIAVFFVPGMFGTTIEYMLKAYSNELTPVPEMSPGPDGSMHILDKELHPRSIDQIHAYFKSGRFPVEIATPIYPFEQAHLPEILQAWSECFGDDIKGILLYAPDLRAAELNILFQYYKISIGSYVKVGLEIFCKLHESDIKKWNQSYTHWTQVKPWEFREWFSLFYEHWVQEWINSKDLANQNFHLLRNTDFLANPDKMIRSIADFCGLTFKKDFSGFLADWKLKQEPIVDEFHLLDEIVASTLEGRSLEWKPISIVGEAIVQRRLRSLGYEIRCDGLDIFPTDSRSLKNLIYSIT